MESERKEDGAVYRIDLYPISLTDKEILFCLLSGMAASLFTEGLSEAMIWIIPAAVGLSAAVAMGLLHSRYPGCLIERLKNAGKELEP